MDATYISRHIAWSLDTFGPGDRTEGLLKHLCKEVREIEARPDDLFEWADAVILALDGAWRTLVYRHHVAIEQAAELVADALHRKQLINQDRDWPDWRTHPQGEPIEHISSGCPYCGFAHPPDGMCI